MLVLLLVRRLSPRARKVTGVVLLALAVAVVAVSVVLHAGLYVHAAILAVLGAVFLCWPASRAR